MRVWGQMLVLGLVLRVVAFAGADIVHSGTDISPRPLSESEIPEVLQSKEYKSASFKFKTEAAEKLKRIQTLESDEAKLRELKAWKNALGENWETLSKLNEQVLPYNYLGECADELLSFLSEEKLPNAVREEAANTLFNFVEKGLELSLPNNLKLTNILFYPFTHPELAQTIGKILALSKSAEKNISQIQGKIGLIPESTSQGLRALSQFSKQSDKVVPIIESHLTHSNPAIREVAFESLSGLGKVSDGLLSKLSEELKKIPETNSKSILELMDKTNAYPNPAVQDSILNLVQPKYATSLKIQLFSALSKKASGLDQKFLHKILEKLEGSNLEDDIDLHLEISRFILNLLSRNAVALNPDLKNEAFTIFKQILSGAKGELAQACAIKVLKEAAGNIEGERLQSLASELTKVMAAENKNTDPPGLLRLLSMQALQQFPKTSLDKDSLAPVLEKIRREDSGILNIDAAVLQYKLGIDPGGEPQRQLIEMLKSENLNEKAMARIPLLPFTAEVAEGLKPFPAEVRVPLASQLLSHLTEKARDAKNISMLANLVAEDQSQLTKEDQDSWMKAFESVGLLKEKADYAALLRSHLEEGVDLAPLLKAFVQSKSDVHLRTNALEALLENNKISWTPELAKAFEGSFSLQYLSLLSKAPENMEASLANYLFDSDNMEKQQRLAQILSAAPVKPSAGRSIAISLMQSNDGMYYEEFAHAIIKSGLEEKDRAWIESGLRQYHADVRKAAEGEEQINLLNTHTTSLLQLYFELEYQTKHSVSGAAKQVLEKLEKDLEFKATSLEGTFASRYVRGNKLAFVFGDHFPQLVEEAIKSKDERLLSACILRMLYPGEDQALSEKLISVAKEIPALKNYADELKRKNSSTPSGRRED